MESIFNLIFAIISPQLIGVNNGEYIYSQQFQTQTIVSSSITSGASAFQQTSLVTFTYEVNYANQDYYDLYLTKLEISTEYDDSYNGDFGTLYNTYDFDLKIPRDADFNFYMYSADYDYEGYFGWNILFESEEGDYNHGLTILLTTDSENYPGYGKTQFTSRIIYESRERNSKLTALLESDTRAYDRGFEEGYTNGYSNGYVEGYTNGSNEDTTVSTIFNGILNVALIPINFFLAIFNFEILGINISSVVSGLLTLAVVIIVVKMFLGSKGGGGSND